ncbi:uncharacterized protein LOC134283470 [Saccostrea cucullata]|uniref:uncharacterized protein LOC134283470 n=1 Tax=Saccostrea cuccullata TaxID=36930 RepID=UPI002ED0373F
MNEVPTKTMKTCSKESTDCPVQCNPTAKARDLLENSFSLDQNLNAKSAADKSKQINEPAQILPKLPSEINILKVRRKGKDDSYKDYRVRRFIVQNALIWLKNNNPVYSDIIISNDRLNQLPFDSPLELQTLELDTFESKNDDQGPAPQQFKPGPTDGLSDSGVLMPEPSIDINQEVHNVVEDIVNENKSKKKNPTMSIPWPTRDNIPISEFTTKYFFTLAFPCLFPYGTGDFHVNRPRTCSSMTEWADHLLLYKDSRFARHPYFKFIVHNIIMRKRTLEQSTYIIKQQLGDEHMTVSELKEQLQNGNNSIPEKILYFGANLRGTSQYWAQRAKELRALIHYQINEGHGLPSFFTTGSCAEFHFKALHRLLQMYTYVTTGEQVDLSNRNTLFSILQANPHVVAHYFEIRTQNYFREVMSPVFKVNTYWYRQEFAKSRGMVHWHGLCCRSDREPHNLLSSLIERGLSDDDCSEYLSNWARSNLGMTASHPAGKDEQGNSKKDLWPPPEGTAPPPPEEKNPLLKLLMDVSESQESLLEDHLLLTNRINIHRCSDYRLQIPKHGGKLSKRVCRMEFGKKTTLSWRANGDVSIILSKSNPENPSVDEIIATERYVSGYACKGNQPTGALVDLFHNLANNQNENSGANAKSICTKLLMNTVKRDISSVEASFELSCLPLFRCSHQFQSVSLSGSRVLGKTGSTVTRHTPLDKNLQRYENDTSSWYQFIYKSGKVPVISGSQIRATWPLNEDYCRTMMLLHMPNWRKIDDLKDNNSTWLQLFTNFLPSAFCPNFVRADVERARRHVEPEASNSVPVEDTENSHSSSQQPEWMDLLAPNPDFDYENFDFKYNDGGPDYDWTRDTIPYPDDKI